MDALTKLVHDVATGEITIVEMTAIEIAEMPKANAPAPLGADHDD